MDQVLLRTYVPLGLSHLQDIMTKTITVVAGAKDECPEGPGPNEPSQGNPSQLARFPGPDSHR